MRYLKPARGPEVGAAMLAVACPGAVPAVDEDAVQAVAAHDLALHVGHEVEVVGSEGAREPHLRRGPVAVLLSVRADKEPVRVGRLHVIISGMRVRAAYDHHSHVPAPLDQVPEHVPVPEPGAAVVERHLGRVVGHAAARAQAHRVAVGPLEVVEPELRVEGAGVVLDECQLAPPHRPSCPRGIGQRRIRRARRDSAEGDGGACEGRGLDERAAR
jgi:hypothetical protein